MTTDKGRYAGPQGSFTQLEDGLIEIDSIAQILMKMGAGAGDSAEAAILTFLGCKLKDGQALAHEAFIKLHREHRAATAKVGDQ
jgi:hypothetical protein